MRLDLIFSMRDIYINSNPNSLTKFTSSSRSTFYISYQKEDVDQHYNLVAGRMGEPGIRRKITKIQF